MDPDAEIIERMYRVSRFRLEAYRRLCADFPDIPDMLRRRLEDHLLPPAEMDIEQREMDRARMENIDARLAAIERVLGPLLDP